MLTIGSEKPVEVKPGMPYFLKAGTPHGFMNSGSAPAVAMEIFVKTSAPSVAHDPAAVLALALQVMADKHAASRSSYVPIAP